MVVSSFMEYPLGQKNVGQNFLHLGKFRHFCPVKQPEDASFFFDKIIVTFFRHCFVR